MWYTIYGILLIVYTSSTISQQQHREPHRAQQHNSRHRAQQQQQRAEQHSSTQRAAQREQQQHRESSTETAPRRAQQHSREQHSSSEQHTERESRAAQSSTQQREMSTHNIVHNTKTAVCVSSQQISTAEHRSTQLHRAQRESKYIYYSFQLQLIVFIVDKNHHIYRILRI